MASNDREERRLMRQRGAGTHKLADVSFGIDVTLPPIPAQELPRVTRSTPQGQQQSAPATSRRQGTQRNIPRSTPQDRSVTIDEDGEGQSNSTPAAAEDNARKRRKLLGPASVRDPSTLYKPPSGSRTTRSSGAAELESLPYRQSPRRKGKEDVDAPSSSPLSGRQQSVLRKGDVLDLPENEDDGTEPQSNAAEREAHAEAPKQRNARRARKSDATEIGEGEDVPSRVLNTSGMPPPAPLMAKRKSGKPRKSDLSGPSLASLQTGANETNESVQGSTSATKKRNLGRRRESNAPENIIETVERDIEAEESMLDGHHTSKGGSRHRKSGSSRLEQAEDNEEHEEVEEEVEEEEEEEEQSEYEDGEQPHGIRSKWRRRPRQATVRDIAPDGRARQRHNRKSDAPLRKRGPASKPDPQRRATAKETFPIIVHRLSTRHQGDYDGPDAIYNPLPPDSNRAGVNAVDVLGQLCRELISGSVQKLQQGAEQEEDEVRVGEWKRKRKAVEAFGEELDERLFEMTEALDYNHALLTRVRKANKKKLELRERLLEIRREREQVALRMDEVRRAHEEGGRAAEDFEIKNSSFHDIELAIERGKTRQEQRQRDGTGEDGGGLVGLEIMLKAVANDVSSINDSGSLLGRIKAFNGFLERAAVVLEGRA